MNNKEREALERAFDIPEPEKCNEFIEELLKKENTKKRRGIVLFQRMPAVLRYSLAACLVIAVIGIIGNIGNLTDTDKYRDKEPASFNSETTTYTPEEESTTETTSAPSQDSYITTISTVSGGNANTTVTTVKGSDIKNTVTSTAKVTGRSVRTLTVHGRTSHPVRTTAAKTTKKLSGIVTTAKAARTSPARTTIVTTIARNNVTTDTPSIPTIPTSPSGIEPAGTGGDHTVEPPVRYDIKGRIYTKDQLSNNKGTEGPPVTDGDVPPSLDNMIRHSDLILLAEVDEVIFTKINGKLTTQENVTIMEPYYGDMNYYERISVYADGGYMPMSEYRPDVDPNGTYYEPGGNTTIAKEGDYYIYFLVKDKNSEAYRLFDGTDNSKFVYRNGMYYCVGRGRDSVSLQELRDRINDLK